MDDERVGGSDVSDGLWLMADGRWPLADGKERCA